MDRNNRSGSCRLAGGPLGATFGLWLFCALLSRVGPACVSPRVAADENAGSAIMVSLDGKWMLATDTKNTGRDQKWWEAPRPEAKETKVPWIIQDAFPGYHGLVWYWREFTAPENPHPGGRYLLRFWAVDYLAEVWLNGVNVGGHEGGEGVFVLDVTDAIKPNEKNQLAVRVLNPSNERIDGIILAETCHYAKSTPFRPGLVFNPGGIVDSVELLVSAGIRVEDLHARPDWKTGAIHLKANLRNAGTKTVKANLTFTVAPAASGETRDAASVTRELPPGDTLVEAEVTVKDHRLWELNDPQLYRVTARAQANGSDSFDEASTRCGFRDFRFENGYFRLNGKRIFLKSSHTATIYPIGLHWPHDPDVARREMIQMKVMGFNTIRFFCSVPTRYQLDLCDELGFMIYEESFAGWFLTDSPKMKERFNHEVNDMITRDRNHPCVIMWGILNETTDGPVFRHAVDMLPLVRSLDETRVVMLNSGRSDGLTGGVSSSAMTGISIWQPKSGALEPNVTFNGNPDAINALGVHWEPGRLSLHPGPNGEFSVIRWTAPAAGDYTVSGKFLSIAEKATTDVHLLHSTKPIFNSVINLDDKGMEAPFTAAVSVNAGATLDFVVGWGNGQFGADSTGVEISVKSADGKTYEAAKEFSVKANPNAVWSYGSLKPGAKPDASTFTLYGKGRIIDAVSEPSEVIGSLSNPGSRVWEDVLSDQHPYQRVPHTAAVVRTLRTLGGGKNPVFMSEYGIGSSLDLVKMTRDYEQLGAEHAEDAQWYRAKLDQFMADWERWNLQDTFANPEDYFGKCLARMGEQRMLGLNCIRANPHCVGHSVTGTTDCGDAGEGLVTLFRQLKPGTVDGIFDGWYPLRWCLFVEPVQVYRKTPAHFDAVLANEDVLKPGEYPVRIQVVGPDALSVFDKTLTVTIPSSSAKPEPAFAIPVFSEDVIIDGPTGKYRFLVTFQKGGAASGGDITFYVADPADMPAIGAEVVLWGVDGELEKWLKDHGIKVRQSSSVAPASREVILVGNKPAAEAAAWKGLIARIEGGSTAIFLATSVFATKDQSAWAPLVKKGSVAELPSWLYHKDEWSKNHPVFDGLPAGGLMDYTFYRDIIPNNGWVGLDVPAEIVAGAINTSIDYSAGLLMSVHKMGTGRYILNTLLIRENLGPNPVAERLLRNLLRYAAQE